MPNMCIVACATSAGVMYYDGADFVRGRGLLLPAVVAQAVARAFWQAGDASVFVMDL